jgi:dienelactone hydrolase
VRRSGAWPRSRWLVGAAFIAAALALALAFRFAPALVLSLALAMPSAEAWLAPFGQRPVREEITLDVPGARLAADLYRPARPRGALLLVHGLSPAGRHHPELVRLARLLAQQGVLVMVPQFESLAAFRLSGREVDEVRSALQCLRGMNGRVGIAGFSFGAGPALLAAADAPGLRVVGSFGGYADLRRVILYIVTGVHTFGGRRYVQPREEYNRWKLLVLLVGFVDDDRDRALLEAIGERKLANPSEDTGALEASLGPEGRTVLELARSRTETAVGDLLDRLPERARQALEGLSPTGGISRISAPLLLAHGAGDPSIPFTESLRLAEAAGQRARVVILESFHHTGPQVVWQSLGHRARDGWRLFLLVDDLLAAQ